MRMFTILLMLVFSGLLGFTLSIFIHDNSRSNIPTIQTFHYPVSFVKQLNNDPDAGRKIFNEFCAACHDNTPTIDVHAPRIGDKYMWKILRKQGIPTLLKTTINGRGAMPARGGCFECNDDQLRQAIKYILEQSKKTAES